MGEVEGALKAAITLSERVVRISIEPKDITKKMPFNTVRLGNLEGIVGYMGDHTTLEGGITLIKRTHQPDHSVPNTTPLIIAHKIVNIADVPYKMEILYRPDR